MLVKTRVTRPKKCVMRVRKFVIIYERSGLIGKYEITRCFREAYTGLPVVRVTENQKALNCVVLKYSIPVSEE